MKFDKVTSNIAPPNVTQILFDYYRTTRSFSDNRNWGMRSLASTKSSRMQK
jgi:hypothetical protein